MTYQPYQRPPPPPPVPPGDGAWFVAVEFSNQGQAKPPTVVQIGSTPYDDREQALAAARLAAFRFQPPDPWSPEARRVYADGPDGFLVMIKGATSVFHLRVRIVRSISDPELR